MNEVEAFMRVEPWSSKSGSKGTLQQAWFRVGNIPPDQRSIMTIAKVAGLVGKAAEIDEKTRYKAEYVRVKIACRDVSRVPRIADATLGFDEYDFTFEREIPEVQAVKMLTSGLKVGEEPPSKKTKAGGSNLLENAGPSNQTENINFAGAKGSGIYGKGASSAPPKLDGGKSVKMSVPNQTVKISEVISTGGGNRITEYVTVEDVEEVDYESDSMSEKLRKIGAYGNQNQKDSQDEESQSHFVGRMEIDGEILEANMSVLASLKAHKKAGDIAEKVFSLLEPISEGPTSQLTQSGEGGGLNLTQESINTKKVVLEGDEDGTNVKNKEGVDNEETKEGEDVINYDETVGNADTTSGCVEKNVEAEVEILKENDGSNEEKQEGGGTNTVAAQVERRRSERNKKDIMLSTQEKNEAMTKKRSLEGNYTSQKKFSDMSIPVMHDTAKKMGVVIANNKFDTFNVIKDLEIARKNLSVKQNILCTASSSVNVDEYVLDSSCDSKPSFMRQEVTENLSPKSVNKFLERSRDSKVSRRHKVEKMEELRMR